MKLKTALGCLMLLLYIIRIATASDITQYKFTSLDNLVFFSDRIVLVKIERVEELYNIDSSDIYLYHVQVIQSFPQSGSPNESLVIKASYAAGIVPPIIETKGALGLFALRREPWGYTALSAFPVYNGQVKLDLVYYFPFKDCLERSSVAPHLFFEKVEERARALNDYFAGRPGNDPGGIYLMKVFERKYLFWVDNKTMEFSEPYATVGGIRSFSWSIETGPDLLTLKDGTKEIKQTLYYLDTSKTLANAISVSTKSEQNYLYHYWRPTYDDGGEAIKSASH